MDTLKQDSIPKKIKNLCCDEKLLGALENSFSVMYKKVPVKIRKRRNQKKIPTPKTEVGKKQTNNQVFIP